MGRNSWLGLASTEASFTVSGKVFVVPLRKLRDDRRKAGCRSIRSAVTPSIPRQVSMIDTGHPTEGGRRRPGDTGWIGPMPYLKRVLFGTLGE